MSSPDLYPVAAAAAPDLDPSVEAHLVDMGFVAPVLPANLILFPASGSAVDKAVDQNIALRDVRIAMLMRERDNLRSLVATQREALLKAMRAEDLPAGVRAMLVDALCLDAVSAAVVA